MKGKQVVFTLSTGDCSETVPTINTFPLKYSGLCWHKPLNYSSGGSFFYLQANGVNGIFTLQDAVAHSASTK